MKKMLFASQHCEKRFRDGELEYAYYGMEAAKVPCIKIRTTKELLSRRQGDDEVTNKPVGHKA